MKPPQITIDPINEKMLLSTRPKLKIMAAIKKVVRAFMSSNQG